MILQKSFYHHDLMLKIRLLFKTMLKTVVLLDIFVETNGFLIFQDTLMNRKFKRTAFI